MNSEQNLNEDVGGGSALNELPGLTPQIRVVGLRGDGSYYPWKPWNENTINWFNSLSASDKSDLKNGKMFKVRSFFCLVEEVACVPNV